MNGATGYGGDAVSYYDRDATEAVQFGAVERVRYEHDGAFTAKLPDGAVVHVTVEVVSE